jgi:cobyric acid synthase
VKLKFSPGKLLNVNVGSLNTKELERNLDRFRPCGWTTDVNVRVPNLRSELKKAKLICLPGLTRPNLG